MIDDMDVEEGVATGHIRDFMLQTVKFFRIPSIPRSTHHMGFVDNAEYQPATRLALQIRFIRQCGEILAELVEIKAVSSPP